MDKLKEKLREYGLWAFEFFSTQEIADITSELTEMKKEREIEKKPAIKEVDLYVLLNGYMDIYVKDVKRFKEIFQIPQKYEEAMEFLFERVSIEIYSDGLFEFTFNSSELEIECNLGNMLESGQADFLKKNKIWALKKAFSPETAVREMASLQMELMERMVEEEMPMLTQFQADFQLACNEVWEELHTETANPTN